MPLYGKLLMYKLLDVLPPNSNILNVGVKRGLHSLYFIDQGHTVFGVSPMKQKMYHDKLIYHECLLEDLEVDGVDAIWSSMTIEHTPNPGLFLRKCLDILDDGKLFAIVAPSDRNDILVDGHLNFWTPASLIYNMVVAGWDCKEAIWYTQGRDIGLLVRKSERPEIELEYDNGDLKRLQPYFPLPLIHRKTDPWIENNWS